MKTRKYWKQRLIDARKNRYRYDMREDRLSVTAILDLLEEAYNQGIVDDRRRYENDPRFINGVLGGLKRL